MNVKQIVLTEKCNLNCSYCYVDQKDNMMTKEIFLDHFKTFDQDYKIDLFGGEPLLNWDLVEFITGKCLTSSKARCMGINLYSNGLLLDQEKVDFIKRFDINFFWSYDGIWCDYEPDIKVVKQLTDEVSVQVGPPNLNMSDNYEYYIKLGFTPSFGLIRDNIWVEDDIQKFRVEFKQLCDRYVYHLQNGNNYIPGIIKKLLGSLQEGLINQTPFWNCGAGVRMDALMPDGKVFPCERFGTLEYVIENKDVFKKCNSCYLNNFCDKGCYHQAVLNDGPVESICELYEIVFNEVINLNRKLKGNKIWQKMVKEMML